MVCRFTDFQLKKNKVCVCVGGGVNDILMLNVSHKHFTLYGISNFAPGFSDKATSRS